MLFCFVIVCYCFDTGLILVQLLIYFEMFHIADTVVVVVVVVVWLYCSFLLFLLFFYFFLLFFTFF